MIKTGTRLPTSNGGNIGGQNFATTSQTLSLRSRLEVKTITLSYSFQVTSIRWNPSPNFDSYQISWMDHLPLFSQAVHLSGCGKLHEGSHGGFLQVQVPTTTLSSWDAPCWCWDWSSHEGIERVRLLNSMSYLTLSTHFIIRLNVFSKRKGAPVIQQPNLKESPNHRARPTKIQKGQVSSPSTTFGPGKTNPKPIEKKPLTSLRVKKKRKKTQHEDNQDQNATISAAASKDQLESSSSNPLTPNKSIEEQDLLVHR